MNTNDPTFNKDSSVEDMLEEIELLRRFVRVQCQVLGSVMSAKFAVERGEEEAEKVRELARYCIQLGYSVAGVPSLAEVKPGDLKTGSSWWVRVASEDHPGGWDPDIAPGLFLGGDGIDGLWDVADMPELLPMRDVQPVLPIPFPLKEMIDLIPLPGANSRP